MFKVSASCKDYRGCGRAWVATDRANRVVAIRYMDDYAPSSLDLPAWVRAVSDAADGLDGQLLPTARSARTYSQIGKAAYDAGAALNSRGNRRRPSELLSMARDLIGRARDESFRAHRDDSRAYCAQRGVLRSGMVSCYEFVEGRSR